MMRCLVKNIAMFGIGLYIYADGGYSHHCYNSEEISLAIGMIDQAIDTNDADYVSKIKVNFVSLMYRSHFSW